MNSLFDWMLVAPRVEVSLQSLIAKAFGNGEQGAIYVPQPVIGGQQVLNQDVGETIPVTRNLDYIGSASDVSPNQSRAVQADDDSRAVYVSNGTTEGFYFRGNNFLETNNPAISQPYIISVSFCYVGDPEISQPMFAIDGIESQRAGLKIKDGYFTPFSGSEDITPGIPIDNEPHTLTVYVNGQDSEIYWDNSSAIKTDVGSNAFSLGFIGSDQNGGFRFDGYLFSFIVREGYGNQALIDEIHKYGISKDKDIPLCIIPAQNVISI